MHLTKKELFFIDEAIQYFGNKKDKIDWNNKHISYKRLEILLSKYYFNELMRADSPSEWRNIRRLEDLEIKLGFNFEK